MKQTISVTGLDGKKSTKEFNTRSPEVVAMRQFCRAATFQPKKGKGSFKRNKKNFNWED
jgi:stalled ribosome alternative rescue factor ArfA